MKSNPSAHVLLESYCNKLMEHFDTVQIIVTKHNPKENSTSMDCFGRGNHFANLAAVEEWLEEDRERSIRMSQEDDD